MRAYPFWPAYAGLSILGLPNLGPPMRPDGNEGERDADGDL